MSVREKEDHEARLFAAKIAEKLRGKTIAEVKTYAYIGWPCIEEIVFTDGTILSLWGAADCAIIGDVEIT